MAAIDDRLREREQGLYTVLEDWPDVRCLTVGGYAASAWAYPRFSHDLDFVVPEGDSDALREHLHTAGLAKVRERPELDQNYGGSWERWEGGGHGVTIDLLVNSVQDRTFQVPIPFRELWKDHAVRPIRGLSESGARLPVVSKEALIALKVQPMRSKDIGDICSMAYAGYDADRLRQLLGPVIEREADLLAERVQTLRDALGATPQEMQRALGPRFPGFARIREDMARSIDGLAGRIERWTAQDRPG